METTTAATTTTNTIADAAKYICMSPDKILNKIMYYISYAITYVVSLFKK